MIRRDSADYKKHPTLLGTLGRVFWWANIPTPSDKVVLNAGAGGL